jgi:hypothetical protein
VGEGSLNVRPWRSSRAGHGYCAQALGFLCWGLRGSRRRDAGRLLPLAALFGFRGEASADGDAEPPTRLTSFVALLVAPLGLDDAVRLSVARYLDAHAASSAGVALAERIPPEKLSRVTSYDWMVSGGLLPLGYVLAGPLAAALGQVEVVVGGSVLAFLAFALGLFPRGTRNLERLGSSEALQSAGARAG